MIFSSLRDHHNKFKCDLNQFFIKVNLTGHKIHIDNKSFIVIIFIQTALPYLCV